MKSLMASKAAALSDRLTSVRGGVVMSLLSVLGALRKPEADELSIEPARDLVPERQHCTMCSNSAENVWIDLPFASLKGANQVFIEK